LFSQGQHNDAAMTLANLVFSDQQYCEANPWIRKELPGGISPVLTIIIAGIYDEKWLLEIEAFAAE
jgi:2-iminobutanoate/2-iminopropanoate deaminase